MIISFLLQLHSRDLLELQKCFVSSNDGPEMRAQYYLSPEDTLDNEDPDESNRVTIFKFTILSRWKLEKDEDRLVMKFRGGNNDEKSIGVTSKVVLALVSPPNLAPPSAFSFNDPFTTIHCTRKLVFSEQLAKRLRDGKRRGRGVASYEVHRLGGTITDGGHNCIPNAESCSSTRRDDLIGFKPHQPTPNSLISYALANHENIVELVQEHIKKCKQDTCYLTELKTDNGMSTLPSPPDANNISALAGVVCTRSKIHCLEQFEKVIINNLPTSYKYAVLKLGIRILEPPQCIGDGLQTNQSYLEDDDEAHMRFQASGCQPITELKPSLVAKAFEALSGDGPVLDLFSSWVEEKQRAAGLKPSDSCHVHPAANTASDRTAVGRKPHHVSQMT